MSIDAVIHQTDCITGMAERLEPESIDLCVTSIPFGALFSYSGKVDDLGNNRDGIALKEDQFGLHLNFWAEQMYRVMRPGRIVAIHLQQLLTWKVQHGHQGRRDLRAAVIDIMENRGFHWTSEFVIPKNPQVIAQRLKLHSLLFVTGKRDATALAPAVCDWIALFRKPGENARPVPAVYDREENPGGWVTTEEWIRWAHGVWGDIQETDVLENWTHGRDEDDEKHVCPLQLEVIRRLVRLYTNPGEVVLDPFMGIGSTGWVAVEQGRSAVGFELKESYAKLAERNIERKLAEMRERSGQPQDLFSYMNADRPVLPVGRGAE